MIPDEVLREIVARAKMEWPDDREMQKYCIAEEKEGYAKLQTMDFGNLTNLKNAFIESAKESFDAWNEVCDSVESELSAYRDLLAFSVEGLSHIVIEEWKKEARREYEGYYAGQLEFLEKKAKKHASILTTRQQIDPIKQLLIELEAIVGKEC